MMNDMCLNRLDKMKPLRGFRLLDTHFSIDMNALTGKRLLACTYFFIDMFALTGKRLLAGAYSFIDMDALTSKHCP